MRFNLAYELNDAVLAGAVNGKVAFAAFVRTVEKEPSDPSPFYFDFKDVHVATASFLRESVFAFKAYLRSVDSKFYPVAANANEAVYDELLMVAHARGDAILGCQIDEQEEVFEPHVIGQLDPKQQLTFDLVAELKRADATGLMERYGAAEQTKGATAWNNRLAGLAARGLIFEYSRGRAKYYRPVLETGD
ncbi:hypothetical protein AMC87_PB00293 (plasmid) [Rhizobium phaseoli]|uniref:hypothetical protein n=1 Tax=Rhizobium phaseoli TaxID=396 RepID=UPI0007F1807B|nr:hypothetical protein [Rhizobium phaseoli]ANL49617.1 hypothetical protein AMC87_PB00293 [Rhizobium phaseoli]